MLINLVDWVPQQEQAAVLFSDWLFAILSGKRRVFFLVLLAVGQNRRNNRQSCYFVVDNHNIK
jgi:hypothetical protein